MSYIETQEKIKGAENFSSSEVKSAALEYFNGDELAATTWMAKYAVQDQEGNFMERTPADTHLRMAREFARIEAFYEKQKGSMFVSELSEYGQNRKALDEDQILNFFNNFKYIIPQGSVMAGLGHPYRIASLSNCVVMPSPFDSYSGIMHTDEQLTQLFKRRCGVGIDISTLRPSGQNVNNAAGTTSGAVSFMERFSNTTREVAQNGRRGALMLTIDIAHPDAKDFVTIKQDLSKVTGANISLRLSDEFMKAVAEDSSYTQRWPINAAEPEVSQTIQARELWDEIIKCAHNTAEPGLIFWDRQHNYSTSSVYPEFENLSTNPCSEIAMQGGDSCRLMALNLYSFVDDPFTDKASFNFDKFYAYTYEGQRLMDDLVDLELEHISKILNKVKADPEPDYIKDTELRLWNLLHDTGKKGRRTGLGFTALADAIAALGLRVDDAQGLDMVDQIMRCKMKGEFDSSIDMSIERGSFGGFDPGIENTSEFVQMMAAEFPEMYNRMMQHGRRNISISTVAPTGTISMLAQTTSGIEPPFMLSYKRRRKLNEKQINTTKATFIDELGDAWEEFDVYHPKLKTWMEVTGKENLEESPYLGMTANEIDWIQRVELQAIVQKYTTHSISSTINLPNDVALEKVAEIYLESWKRGLKGITVYRDGSRSGVLVSKDEKTESKAEADSYLPRPEVLEARVLRFKNEREDWLAVVGTLNDRPYEIFTGKAEEAFNLPAYVSRGWILRRKEEEGLSRYDFRYRDSQGYNVTIEGLSRSFSKEFWNYAKLISGVLRHNMPIPHVVELINNLNLDQDYINTWTAGVARALKTFIPDGTVAADKKCPECSDSEGLIYEEGCLKCKSCGYAKCG
ncbi:MAG: adenosylcobalamin-dependent ribonucleoside-diphosphate reductase [Bacteroidetes bacterium]|nr:adenosylcobalamin-dependent ribonucleoside-diphosphate reductase [Bacteroidota bacterium]